MFILKIYDSAGKELKQGDIVRVDSGRGDRECAVFFAEVTWLEKEKAIAPFHTFSYHKFFKVDSVPQEAVKSNEERYNFWYINNGENSEYDAGSQYLSDWRQCEHLLENKCYRIELIASNVKE